jgi:hypothetical protein
MPGRAHRACLRHCRRRKKASWRRADRMRWQPWLTHSMEIAPHKTTMTRPRSLRHRCRLPPRVQLLGLPRGRAPLRPRAPLPNRQERALLRPHRSRACRPRCPSRRRIPRPGPLSRGAVRPFRLRPPAVEAVPRRRPPKSLGRLHRPRAIVGRPHRPPVASARSLLPPRGRVLPVRLRYPWRQGQTKTLSSAMTS